MPEVLPLFVRTTRYRQSRVISGAASSGQQVMTGRRVKSAASSPDAICTAGESAPRNRFRRHIQHFMANCGSLSNRSRNAFGGRFFQSANNLPASRNARSKCPPMPIATRFGVPKGCTTPAWRDFRIFKLGNAGPPARSVRSAISVISR